MNKQCFSFIIISCLTLFLTAGASSSSSSSSSLSTTPPWLKLNGGAGSQDDPEVEMLREEAAWVGPFRSILSRTIRLPGSRAGDIVFDVLSPASTESVLVVCWDSATRTATLIREYHPGPLVWQYGVIAGGYEPHKHDSPMTAARFELEEEAQLEGGRWVPLLNTAGSLAHDKYSTERFFPWLVIDAKPCESPRECDTEESIRVEHGFTASTLRELIRQGAMNCPSSFAVLLALERLQEMDLL